MARLTVPGRCHFDSNGWLRGPINITHVMTPNRYDSGFGTGRGMVMHTEDGFEAGTVSTFLNPGSQVSSFFSIGRDGSCHQYLPVGKGYVAWTQGAGNEAWRGVEDEDERNPAVPLTAAQVTTFAQIFEACSAFDGFPLQVTDSINGHGLVTHAAGGTSWGGHFSCPGSVRAAQRLAVVTLAKQIRAGAPPVPQFRTFTADGHLTLAGIAGRLKAEPCTILRMTCENSPKAIFTDPMTAYLGSVFDADMASMGPGLKFWYSAKGVIQPWVTDPGTQPLSGLATQLGSDVSALLRLTCEHSPGGFFAPDVAAYINGVMSRSVIPVPAGEHLMYP